MDGSVMATLVPCVLGPGRNLGTVTAAGLVALTGLRSQPRTGRYGRPGLRDPELVRKGPGRRI